MRSQRHYQVEQRRRHFATEYHDRVMRPCVVLVFTGKSHVVLGDWVLGDVAHCWVRVA